MNFDPNNSDNLSEYYPLDYIDIRAGASKFILFEVIRKSIWYNEYSTVAFEFRYDGVYYTDLSSSNIGFFYEEQQFSV